MCHIQIKIAFFLAKEHSINGRKYVPLEKIYKALCKDDDDTCKATIRKALNIMWKKGLLDKHYKAKNKREYRLAGDLYRLWRELDEVYRYGK